MEQQRRSATTSCDDITHSQLYFPCAGIILITDGNVGIGDVGRFDNLLVQLLSQSCTCSVIEVNCENNVKRGLGRVPHSEMLRFIATATFGAYFSETPCMVRLMQSMPSKVCNSFPALMCTILYMYRCNRFKVVQKVKFVFK